MRIPTTVSALVVLAALATGCSEAEDAARDAAGDATCAVARSAVDEAGQQAGSAADEIGADPQAAERELQALRDALAAAERGVDGDIKAKVGEAKTAIEDLLGEAKDAADGAPVDTKAVDRAQADLEAAVDDVKGLC